MKKRNFIIIAVVLVLGININFLARAAQPGEFPQEQEAVITDDDLSKINFPVSIQG